MMKAIKLAIVLFFICSSTVNAGMMMAKESVRIRGADGNYLSSSLNPETEQYELIISSPGHICTKNSTTTPLTGDATFTGEWVDTLEYGVLIVGIKADQNSATDGLVIQWSQDGNTVHETDTYSIIANHGKVFTFGPARRYVRVVYTNGSVAQSSISLETTLRRCYIKPSSHRINDAIVAEDDAELIKAVLTGENPSGLFVNFKSTTAGNFKVSLEEFENTISVNSNSQLRATLFDSSGTELSFIDGKARTSSMPYLFDIAEGNVPGHTSFAKYGRVDGIANTIADIWYGEGGTASVYVFPETAQQMEVLSSSGDDTNGGSGINTITITGLDANYAETSESITMAGATPVTTTNSYLRLNGCYATSAGSGGVAAGNIIIQNTANSITYAAIPVGLTACRDLIYTVPAGKTLYITSIHVASGKGGNTTNLNAVIFTPLVRPFGGTAFLPQGELLSINTDSIRILESPTKILEKSDMKMSVIGDYLSGSSKCIGAVRGWLETN